MSFCQGIAQLHDANPFIGDGGINFILLIFLKKKKKKLILLI